MVGVALHILLEHDVAVFSELSFAARKAMQGLLLRVIALIYSSNVGQPC